MSLPRPRSRLSGDGYEVSGVRYLVAAADVFARGPIIESPSTKGPRRVRNPYLSPIRDAGRMLLALSQQMGITPLEAVKPAPIVDPHWVAERLLT